MSDGYDVYYEGRRIGAAEAVEIQSAQARQTRRSAEMHLPSRRLGRSSWLFTITHVPFDPILDVRLFAQAKPRKHWVRDKDWTQRQPNRRRGKKR